MRRWYTHIAYNNPESRKKYGYVETLHPGNFGCDSMNDDKNNCSVIALKLVTGVTMKQAYNICKKAGRKDNEGFETDDFFNKHSIVLKHRFTQIISEKDRAVNIKRFVEKYPKGAYYVAIKGHAIAIVDGIVYDHTPRGKSDKIISAYKVEFTTEKDTPIKKLDIIKLKEDNKDKFDKIIELANNEKQSCSITLKAVDGVKHPYTKKKMNGKFILCDFRRSQASGGYSLKTRYLPTGELWRLSLDQVDTNSLTLHKNTLYSNNKLVKL